MLHTNNAHKIIAIITASPTTKESEEESEEEPAKQEPF